MITRDQLDRMSPEDLVRALYPNAGRLNRYPKRTADTPPDLDFRKATSSHLMDIPRDFITSPRRNLEDLESGELFKNDMGSEMSLFLAAEPDNGEFPIRTPGYLFTRVDSGGFGFSSSRGACHTAMRYTIHAQDFKSKKQYVKGISLASNYYRKDDRSFAECSYLLFEYLLKHGFALPADLLQYYNQGTVLLPVNEFVYDIIVPGPEMAPLFENEENLPHKGESINDFHERVGQDLARKFGMDPTEFKAALGKDESDREH